MPAELLQTNSFSSVTDFLNTASDNEQMPNIMSISESKSFGSSESAVEGVMGVPDIGISLTTSEDEDKAPGMKSNLATVSNVMDDSIHSAKTEKSAKPNEVNSSVSIASSSSKGSTSTGSKRAAGKNANPKASRPYLMPPHAQSHPPHGNFHGQPYHGGPGYHAPPPHYHMNAPYYGAPGSAPYPGGPYEQRFHNGPSQYGSGVPPPHYHPSSQMHQNPNYPQQQQSANYHPRSYPPPHYPPPPYRGGQHPGVPPQSYQQIQTAASSASSTNNSTKSGNRQSAQTSNTPSSSASVTSTGSNRKKRTIDGLLDTTTSNPTASSGSAFTVHRSNSNSSACSVGTSGYNTAGSDNMSNLVCESPMKRERTSSGNPIARNNKVSPGQNETSSATEAKRGRHVRSNSSSSTASSLSFGGLSMGSYDKAGRAMKSFSYDNDESQMLEASPKRRKAQSVRKEENPPDKDEHRDQTNDYQRPNFKEEREGVFREKPSGDSPFRKKYEDTGVTPVSKNTRKTKKDLRVDSNAEFSFNSFQKEENVIKQDSRPAIPEANAKKSDMDFLHREKGSSFDSDSLFPASDMIKEEPLLNRHLRGQSFTPIPHVNVPKKEENVRKVNSPTFDPDHLDIAPQLSWSSSPALADLQDFVEGGPKEGAKEETPTSFDGGNISPMFWKSEEPASSGRKHQQSSATHVPNRKPVKNDRGMEEMNLKELSPASLDDDILGGKTTPLPFFFDSKDEKAERRAIVKEENPTRSPPMSSYGYNKSRDERRRSEFPEPGSRTKLQPVPNQSLSSPSFHHQSNPPTPLSGQRWHDDNYMRNGRSSGRRDGPPEYSSPPAVYGTPGPHMSGANQGDRVRNLRGRAPPPSPHQHGGHTPQALHLPPHVQSHQHFLTSPIGSGGFNRNMLPLGSPHQVQRHNFPRSPHLSASKRKCVPLKTPIPSKFQGDMEKMKTAQVPEFTSLVNFPSHMSQKQSLNLPEGLRCCVMCGHACPCSAANKNKKGKKADGDRPLGTKAPQASLSNPNGSYAIIPTQNKGLCTHCDVNVWVVTQSGLEIKWCKGCKNFRPWAAFGDKGLATKCVRCRERQREKYAAQKEEKEKNKALARAKNAAKAR